ncbi:hypothetical protein DXA91_11605 [Clostridium sp. OF09-10]|nr:hypothetical protein [Clostridium sp. OF09-10]RHV97747.1 hypothetical protein DXA91_11605 [Clostridium sp. OF09-10]
MKKRILSMVCAGLLGASLVGCSQPAATATTAAPAAETKAETAAASGDSAKTADTTDIKAPEGSQKIRSHLLLVLRQEEALILQQD